MQKETYLTTMQSIEHVCKIVNNLHSSIDKKTLIKIDKYDDNIAKKI